MLMFFFHFLSSDVNIHSSVKKYDDLFSTILEIRPAHHCKQGAHQTRVRLLTQSTSQPSLIVSYEKNTGEALIWVENKLSFTPSP